MLTGRYCFGCAPKDTQFWCQISIANFHWQKLTSIRRDRFIRERFQVLFQLLTRNLFNFPSRSLFPRPFLDWAPSTRPVSLGGKPPSSKEAPALPAPLADWSGNPFAASSPRRTVQLRTSFHRLPAEIGPSVARRIFLPLPAFR
jgi:hypothetical protein